MKRASLTIIGLITHIAFFWSTIDAYGSNDHPAFHYPDERIKVHLAQECLFTGEIIWFKIYCTSSLFPAEELSRLAFIELVNGENAAILRKKILLSHGEGRGEFIIPAGLSTGIYYILAYTNWMKNFGEECFYRERIVIINPDQPYTNSIEDTGKIKQDKPAGSIKTTFGLKVLPDKEKYSTREKVSIRIEGTKLRDLGSGRNLSVSVCRKEPAIIDTRVVNPEKGLNKELEKLIYLPDYKGIRLSGTLVNSSGNAMTGTRIVLSQPGMGTDINSTITDNDGTFNFLLKLQEGVKDVVFTFPENGVKMNLEESFWNGFRHIPDKVDLRLSREAVAYLEDRFACIQIQEKFKQIYFRKIYNPAVSLADSGTFYSNPYQDIRKSDYFTLDSLTEYFHELIPFVKFVPKKGKFNITVINPNTQTINQEPPGVFIDGVLYSDYDEVAHIPVEKVERIAIIPETYYYRDFTFGGIIDIHTKKCDFNSIKILPNMVRIMFPLAFSNDLEYIAPAYSPGDSLKRIPDFRYLICWEPVVKTGDSGQALVQFFTGDIPGEFVVKVVGISKEGEILESEKIIKVGMN